MSEKEYYRTVFFVEVLSEDPYNPNSLAAIARDILDGGMVGNWGEEYRLVLTGKEMADNLTQLGSEPGFFRLDKDGEKIDT